MSWDLFIVAFGMPAFVVLFAYVAMRVHEHWLHKQPGYGPNDRKD